MELFLPGLPTQGSKNRPTSLSHRLPDKRESRQLNWATGPDASPTMQQSTRTRNLSSILVTEIPSVRSTMRASTLFLCAALLYVSMARLSTTAAQAPGDSSPAAQSDEEKQAMLDRVIANQKKNDEAEMVYERIEHKDVRKGPGGTPPEI